MQIFTFACWVVRSSAFGGGSIDFSLCLAIAVLE